jgi:hypothetical protein
MRRASQRTICKPAAVSGEEIASRAARGSYASREPAVTGSLGSRTSHSHHHEDDDDE